MKLDADDMPVRMPARLREYVRANDNLKMPVPTKRMPGEGVEEGERVCRAVAVAAVWLVHGVRE